MEENVEEKIRSITEQANQTRKMLLEEYLGHSISMEEAINNVSSMNSEQCKLCVNRS